jgi:hypothetical protein
LDAVGRDAIKPLLCLFQRLIVVSTDGLPVSALGKVLKALSFFSFVPINYPNASWELQMSEGVTD